MELREYLKVFKKYWPFIVVVAILGATLGGFYASKMPQGYKNSQTFFLTPQATTSEEQTFYAQEKARNFTDSAVAIISSPDFKSQITGEGESLIVRKLAPQVLQITTFSNNSSNSKALQQRAVNLANERFSTNLQSIGKAAEPTYTAPKQLAFALAGIIAGAAFAIFAISLKTYFRL